MFTGLVSDVGEIVAAEGDPAVLRRYRIRTVYDPDTILTGASIACSGICLTAIGKGRDGAGAWFDVQAAAETLARTLAGRWNLLTRLNLERSLKVGDELGGHMVTGHVDGVVAVVGRTPIGETIRFELQLPAALARFVAEKGSIALDGVSLTVNGVEADRFTVLIIPHTLAVTTLGGLVVGSSAHIEVDLMARYAARLAQAKESGY